MVEELGRPGLHYDVKELFEPITKTLTDASQKLLEETRFNTKAIENLDESNNYVEALVSMNKIEVSHSALIRPIVKLLVAKNESQFRLLDDPDEKRAISGTYRSRQSDGTGGICFLPSGRCKDSHRFPSKRKQLDEGVKNCN